ncbi:MAG TPA: ABC transporter ATP-binding protein, partial [Gammaproteobacteria bacterium]|nr:ABC transporter ATP-binding protein [Gammaproteobacteria bacterium]
YKFYAFLFIFCAMMTGTCQVIQPFFTKLIINILDSKTEIKAAFWPALFFILSFEINNLSWRGLNYISYKTDANLKSNIISNTFSYVCQHSHKFFQDNLAGRISSNINTLAENIVAILYQISHHIIRGLIVLLGALLSMYLVNPLFFYGLLCWTILFGVISWFASKNVVAFANTLAERESLVSGQLVDSVSNNQNIRFFANTKYESSYLLKSLQLMKEAFQKKELFRLKFYLLQGFSFTAMLAFMMYTLFTLRIKNLVSIGDFALILGLSVEVGFTVWYIAEQIDMLNNAIGKCKQSINMLFVPLEIKDFPNAKTLNVTKGEIVFDSVQFHYKNINPLFQNKSITINAGSKTGLVGYSGSGKSTFVNLILRLFDVNSGHILIDNQDIKQVTQDSLHNAIGMIPQEPSLFHRSIMENIRYGNIEASDSEVIEAAKRAHAHEFIVKTPQGYDALVGERGIKLSGGQRQRIAIARAMLKNAPILILDEATSQLDSITEQEIQESLNALMENKTTLVIAHRLSTLLHMDNILVFDEGKIVESGSHQALHAKHGLYKALWDAQVGGFLPEKR